MKICAVFSSVLFIASAFFWWRSSRVAISFAAKWALGEPTDNITEIKAKDYWLAVSKLPVPMGVDESLKQMSVLNCVAAICAAIAAVFAGIGVLLA